MNRFAVPAIVVGVIVLGIALIVYVLGVNLLPTYAEAVERQTVAPYYIVWTMIWVTELCALSLAASLLQKGVQGLSAR